MIESLAALALLTVAAADNPACTLQTTHTLRARLTISSGVAEHAGPIVRRAIEDAWRPEGLTFQWVTEGGDDTWRGVDVWIAAVHGMKSSEEAAVMGIAQFEGDVPLRLIRVSIDAVVGWIRQHQMAAPGAQAPPPRDTVDGDLLVAQTLGYAAAHEVGHFVLASRTHASSGLMQAVQRAPAMLNRPSTWRLDAVSRVRLQQRLHGSECNNSRTQPRR